MRQLDVKFALRDLPQNTPSTPSHSVELKQKWKTGKMFSFSKL